MDARVIVDGGTPVDPPDGGSLEQANAPDGKRALLIRAGPVTSASWRKKVLLPPGKYRLEGAVRTEAVAPLNFGKNHGATLRVPGFSATRPQPLLGDQPWKLLAVSFATTAREQEVEVQCELRASRGRAWFDLESLRLVREK